MTGVSPTKGLIERFCARCKREGAFNSSYWTKARGSGNKWHGDSTLAKLNSLTPANLDQNGRTGEAKIRPDQKRERGEIRRRGRQKMTLPKQPEKGHQAHSPKRSMSAITEIKEGRKATQNIDCHWELGNGGSALGSFNTPNNSGKDPIIQKRVTKPQFLMEKANIGEVDAN